jgi:signal transduction histidine kinase
MTEIRTADASSKRQLRHPRVHADAAPYRAPSGCSAQPTLQWVPNFFFVLSEEGVYLDYGVSPNSELLIPPEHFLGSHVSQVFEPELATRFLEAMEQARCSGTPACVAHTMDFEGVTRYYRARFRFRRDRKFMCFVFDLTDTPLPVQNVRELAGDVAHADRVSLVGRLAASLIHELGQPLTAMLANAKAGQRVCNGRKLSRMGINDILADIVQSGEYAAAVTERFRAFLHKEGATTETLDLNSVVNEVEVLVRAELASRRVSLELQLASRRQRILGDRIQLQQVLLNLLLNSADAVSDRSPGLVTIRTRGVHRGVELLVEDNGPGFSPDQLAGCFRPFVSTKPKGMGMGLAICEEIVRIHGGKFTVLNRSSGGARVRIVLPTAAKRCSPQPAKRAEGDPLRAFESSWELTPADLPSESRITARQLRAELLPLQLRIAMTLLDCARSADEPGRTQRSRDNAWQCLSITDELLETAALSPLQREEVAALRHELLERLDKCS